jgi:hypothetical protein
MKSQRNRAGGGVVFRITCKLLPLGGPQIGFAVLDDHAIVNHNRGLLAIGGPGIERRAIEKDLGVRGGLDHHCSPGLDERGLRALGVVNMLGQARNLGCAGCTFDLP